LGVSSRPISDFRRGRRCRRRRRRAGAKGCADRNIAEDDAEGSAGAGTECDADADADTRAASLGTFVFAIRASTRVRFSR